MNETDYSYIAGVLDSDGCIQVAKSQNCSSNYQLQIHVIQKKMPIIEYLYKKIGGGVSLVWRTHKTTRYYFRIVITGERAANLLKGCVPFLKNKREQALLGIEMQSIILPKGRAKKLPKEVIERRNQIALAIKALNSPATTECGNSFSSKEMRQSELTEMKNRQRVG